MGAFVKSGSYIGFRLPNGSHKVVQITPDTIVSLGKYGSFSSNLILARPYHVTFEIVEHSNAKDSTLRVVSAAEIHAETLDEKASAAETRDDDAGLEDEGIKALDDKNILENNQLTLDEAARQTLSFEEIEELKKQSTGSGKEIVAKILESHSNISEKTAFSLAKYIVRKNMKYRKRFTVLPLDVSLLTHWMLHEREAAKIMELREETLGLVASWANAHYTPEPESESPSTEPMKQGNGRWLVVDDTAGLVVATLAERMSILYPSREEDDSQDEDKVIGIPLTTGAEPYQYEGDSSPRINDNSSLEPSETSRTCRGNPSSPTTVVNNNTITMLHAAAQPNLSLLSYFNFDLNDISQTSTASQTVPAHPLHSHLHTLTWMELLDPESCSSYAEPPPLSPATLSTLKSNKRGTYHRKRRRWQRARTVIDSTRAGGFDGLVIASFMEPCEILHHLVPLLRGGAPVVVYSPSIEPLVQVMDAYSSARRTAFVTALKDAQTAAAENGEAQGPEVPSGDFPLDPRLVLAPSLHTVRAREWQTLLGRMHPKMTERGGAEGYVFTATRVLPSDEQVSARGRFAKKRKVDSTVKEDVNGVAH